MGEIRPLTGARGIAAWWVVLFHLRASIPGLSPTVQAVLAKGYLAVDFFFLLSGFVIWLAWGPRLHEEGARAVAPFLAKRVARIWPLHLAMLALAVALAAVLAAAGRPDPGFPWAELPLHVALVQNWGWTERLAWNDPAWSISAELGAYLAMPLLAWTVDWRRVATPWLLAGAAAMLLALHLAMRGEPTLGADIPRYGLIRCLAEFGAGTIVAALWLRYRDRRTLAPVAAGLCAAMLGIWAAGVAETLAVPAAFAALLLMLAATADGRNNPLGWRPVHYLGEVSYATYLSHFLLWKIVKLALVTDAAAVPVSVIAAYLALVLSSSALLYHGLERPAQRWINTQAARLLNRPVRRPALPPAPR